MPDGHLLFVLTQKVSKKVKKIQCFRPQAAAPPPNFQAHAPLSWSGWGIVSFSSIPYFANWFKCYLLAFYQYQEEDIGPPSQMLRRVKIIIGGAGGSADHSAARFPDTGPRGPGASQDTCKSIYYQFCAACLAPVG